MMIIFFLKLRSELSLQEAKIAGHVRRSLETEWFPSHGDGLQNKAMMNVMNKGLCFESKSSQQYVKEKSST
jgi:hypothetical protein